VRFPDDANEQLPPALQDVAKAYATPNSLAVQPTRTTVEQGSLLANSLERGCLRGARAAGVWAAAPYLHNGSVPTLADLLKPSAQRPLRFSVGARYDMENIGLAVGADSIRSVTDCNDINSGNSNCGHEYGTSLSDQDKNALLECLKAL
jgi:hypothetical protein